MSRITDMVPLKLPRIASLATLATVAAYIASGCGGGQSAVKENHPRATASRVESRTVGSAGVTVKLPATWHSGATDRPNGNVVDPSARIVVGSAPIRRQSSQCYVASYAPPSDGVTIVVVEWSKTDAVPGHRPQRFTRSVLPLIPDGLDCLHGRGGTTQFVDQDRVFGAYIMLGRDATESLADQARAVLDTLRVSHR